MKFTIEKLENSVNQSVFCMSKETLRNEASKNDVIVTLFRNFCGSSFPSSKNRNPSFSCIPPQAGIPTLYR